MTLRAGCLLPLLKVINHRGEDAVLLHRGIGGFALHRAGTELIGDIEEHLFDRHAGPQAESKKCIGAAGARLGIIEHPRPERNGEARPDPEVFGPEPHTRGIISLAIQHRPPFAGRRPILDQQHIGLLGFLQPQLGPVDA